MSKATGSGLYYSTGEEIRLGDRVRKKRWFRPSINGIACYIPGISPPHPEMEYEDVKLWAMRMDNEIILSAAYNPARGNKQIGRHLVFLSRGEGGELTPDEELF